VLTHLAEKPHIGVLTGSPITDIKMTLVAGRAHLKHTEGGDFRQASYRAVRNGLMKAENILLEPWYDFTLELPSESIGRAISDLQTMSAEFDAPVDMGLTVSIIGKAPVSEMQDYTPTLLSYTKGQGRLSARFSGYFPCHNSAKVIEDTGYEAERDTANSADSVFCSHGSGIIVPWDKVQGFAHIDSGLRFGSDGQVSETDPKPMVNSRNLDIDEREREAIMQREFGEIKRPRYTSVSRDFGKAKQKTAIQKADYCIVDGYNLIFAWDELKKTATGQRAKDRRGSAVQIPESPGNAGGLGLARGSFEAARQQLITMLANYAGYKNSTTVLVFDGYKVKEGQGSRQALGSLSVVYTKEGESADSYIEKLVHEIGKNYSVRIVSSDGMIQLTALQLGVLRVSAREYREEVEAGLARMREELQTQTQKKTTIGDIIG
jgi:predicted RNA-binding protein with PIN domain